MHIPSEHFSNIPVFALCPKKEDEEEADERKGFDRRAMRKHQRESISFFANAASSHNCQSTSGSGSASASSSSRSTRESTPTDTNIKKVDQPALVVRHFFVIVIPLIAQASAPLRRGQSFLGGLSLGRRWDDNEEEEEREKKEKRRKSWFSFGGDGFVGLGEDDANGMKTTAQQDTETTRNRCGGVVVVVVVEEREGRRHNVSHIPPQPVHKFGPLCLHSDSQHFIYPLLLCWAGSNRANVCFQKETGNWYRPSEVSSLERCVKDMPK